MRWGERPPLAGAARDEDAAPLAVAARAPREPQQHPKGPRATIQQALTGTAFGRTTRPGRQRAGAQAVSFPAIDPLGAPPQPETSEPQPQKPPSAFLVCAGIGVSSNNDELPEHPGESFDAAALSFGKAAAGAPAHDHAKKPSSHPTPASSSSLQRSDSELELIINDLREKISLQHRIEETKRRAATEPMHSTRSTGSNGAELHPTRRHLKNPLERVHSNPAMSLDHPSSNLLKRQQSAGSANRPQPVAHGERVAPPEVVATGINVALFSAPSSSSLSRPNLHGSSGVQPHHLSSAYFDEVSLERVYDDEGMQIKSYAQDTGGTSSYTYHPHFHSSPATGAQRPTVSSSAGAKKATRRTRAPATKESGQRSSFDLELQRVNNNADDSDSSSSFDEGDGNPFFARCALSPMGPWVSDASRPEIDGVEARGSPTPPLSSARTEGDFAELSPRTRLLWFSRCADDEPPPSPDTASRRHFQRSASHCGPFRPASAGVSSQQRVDRANSTSVRCASAKSSREHRRTTGSNNDTARSKRASGVPTKKLPHVKSSKVRSEAA